MPASILDVLKISFAFSTLTNPFDLISAAVLKSFRKKLTPKACLFLWEVLCPNEVISNAQEMVSRSNFFIFSFSLLAAKIAA